MRSTANRGAALGFLLRLGWFWVFAGFGIGIGFVVIRRWVGNVGRVDYAVEDERVWDGVPCAWVEGVVEGVAV